MAVLAKISSPNLAKENGGQLKFVVPPKTKKEDTRQEKQIVKKKVFIAQPASSRPLPAWPPLPNSPPDTDDGDRRPPRAPAPPPRASMAAAADLPPRARARAPTAYTCAAMADAAARRRIGWRRVRICGIWQRRRRIHYQVGLLALVLSPLSSLLLL
jgi:hypothetical protein